MLADETNRATTTVYESATGFSLFPSTVTNPAGEATALAGKRSLRLTAVLKLMRRA